jgi:hypothetical protein
MRNSVGIRLPGKKFKKQESGTPGLPKSRRQGPTPEYIWHFKLPGQLMQCLIPTRLRRDRQPPGGENGGNTVRVALPLPVRVAISAWNSYGTKKSTEVCLEPCDFSSFILNESRI